MQLYFANGGGPCWISSAGDYDKSIQTLVSTEIVAALAAFRQIDEVTLLAAPEYGTSSTSPANSYIEMLNQASALQDRFAILDVKHDTNATTSASAFRGLSLTNLKYGAAYYPPLNTGFNYRYTDLSVKVTGVPAILVPEYSRLDLINKGTGNSHKVEIPATINTATNTTALTITVGTVTEVFTAVTDFAVTNATVAYDALTTLIRNRASLLDKIIVVDDYSAPSPNDFLFVITAVGNGVSVNVTGTGLLATQVNTLTTNPAPVTLAANPALYRSVIAALNKQTITLSPSAAIAAVYASVDRDRGVWKAPANVSLNAVIQPAVMLNDADQSGLNVDAVSGKSINVIRQFSGKGNLVWGARTLAGNDTEWRYVNVRRLFCYAEESIKKAIEQVVFEPNDRQTWNRVRTMIGNFLTNLWRDGGLVGATPDQAFYVRVGLGETMTEQDLLDGRLVVKIGMAASRPAEFIELQFSHVLQQG
ncbi:MAG: phage tail sheath family protein [Bacteroidetes bacterium]|nr:phage tail sheath family protein [Bacteroidota bacterium]